MLSSSYHHSQPHLQLHPIALVEDDGAFLQNGPRPLPHQHTICFVAADGALL
jgi:hypothetical protein